VTFPIKRTQKEKAYKQRLSICYTASGNKYDELNLSEIAYL